MADSYFDNIRKNMKPEELERYQQIGKGYFANFCFDKGLMVKTDQNSNSDVHNIIGALRSGLPIDDLTEDDIISLKTSFGDNWVEKIKETIESKDSQ